MSDLDQEPELGIEPIIGWRIWFIQHEDDCSKLSAWTQKRYWSLDEPTVAECEYRDSWLHPSDLPVPDRLCRCGLYALKDPTRLIAELRYYMALHWVIGQVALYGRVLEGEYGYRAERAKIIALTSLAEVAGKSCRWPLPTSAPIVPLAELGLHRTLCDSLYRGAQGAEEDGILAKCLRKEG
jgi:hypothetical protein